MGHLTSGEMSMRAYGVLQKLLPVLITIMVVALVYSNGTRGFLGQKSSAEHASHMTLFTLVLRGKHSIPDTKPIRI